MTKVEGLYSEDTTEKSVAVVVVVVVGLVGLAERGAFSAMHRCG